jgi:pimeloyl-ACP methyl ester carboxylesterase
MVRQINTILMIHGLWLTPRSWDGFRDLFEMRGYRVLTPAWPGIHGSHQDMRRDPLEPEGLGIVEIAEHYEGIVRGLDSSAILIGHSLGGLIVQMLLDRGYGSAGVAISAIPPKGIFRMPISTIRCVSPILSNPLNYNRTVALTLPQFQYAMGNRMTDSDARSAYERQAIPTPGRPIFQAAFANLLRYPATTVNHLNNTRAPLLLVGAEHDHLVPAVLNRLNFRKYEHSHAITDYQEFAGRSHLIVSEYGWVEVAMNSLLWAERRIEDNFNRQCRVNSTTPSIQTARTDRRTVFNGVFQ